MVRSENIKTISSLTALKIAGALVGLLYSILQVNYFGATRLVDSFFIAISAVHIITSLTQGGYLAEVFLPEYLDAKNSKGPSRAFALLSVILNRMVAFLAGILVLVYLLAPYIIQLIGPGLEAEYAELSVRFFRVSLFVVLFSVIASFVNTTLNAEEVYGRAEVTGLINSCISVSLIYLFHEQLGIWILVYALIVGKITEFIVGLFFLNKIGFHYKLIWNIRDFELAGFFRVMFTTSGYVLATQLYSGLITALASTLPAGIFSIFNYVKQLTSKASGILIGPFSTVFFSRIANSITQKKANPSSFLIEPVRIVLMIILLVFLSIILLGQEFLHAIWSDKALTNYQFFIAYLMLVLNFAGLVFLALGTIFRKTAVALGGAKKLYLYWTAVQFLCICFAFMAIKTVGVYGLAILLMVNMALFAVVSVIVATMKGVRSKWIIISVFKKRKVGYITAVLVTTLISLPGLLYLLQLNPYMEFAIKAMVLIALGFATLGAILNVNKKGLVFLNRK